MKETNEIARLEEGLVKDFKSIDKIDNKQLYRATRIAGRGTQVLEANYGGRGRLDALEGVSGNVDQAQLQENHNARHALWYLNMAVYSVIHGKKVWHTREKVERIVAHLSYLEEFLSDRDASFSALIYCLLERLTRVYPATDVAWARFAYIHWQLLRDLAERYGEHETCFPLSQYRKLEDILLGQQTRRVWWWRWQVETTKNRLRHWIRIAIQRNQKGGKNDLTKIGS